MYNNQRIEDDYLTWDYSFMETPPINVAIDELTFSLFQRPLHPELFQIYSQRADRVKALAAAETDTKDKKGSEPWRFGSTT